MTNEELQALIADYEGEVRTIKTGVRALRNRMPPSYDPPVFFHAVEKRDPLVCTRWSDE